MWLRSGFWWLGIAIFLRAFMIAVLVAVIVIIVRGSRGTNRDDGGPEPDALEIAKRRYARGEITKEQFDQLRSDLSK